MYLFVPVLNGDKFLVEELGPCEVHLELSKTFALSFRPLANDWDPINLPILRGAFQLQRTAKGKVCGMECSPREAETLSYLICAPRFQNIETANIFWVPQQYDHFSKASTVQCMLVRRV